MEFHKWLLEESSLNDLYTQTVRAFPKTTKRQHAVDPIKITKLEWIPYLGVKTLYVKGLAQSDSGKEYEPIIVFKGVNYKPFDNTIKKEGTVDIIDNMGNNYKISPISFINNDVLVRCQCEDFKYRWQHYNHLDKSLFGKNRKPYIGQNLWKANPSESSGLCKHVLKMIKILKESSILVEI